MRPHIEKTTDELIHSFVIHKDETTRLLVDGDVYIEIAPSEHHWKLLLIRVDLEK